jgi:4-diphosphocytidyl-2-C-methyl-D-erythritol kinase
MRLTLETRTKINAWLRVLPKEKGAELHGLESLFLPIALGDRLIIDTSPSQTPGFLLSSNRPDLVPGNTVQQAWNAFVDSCPPARGRPSFQVAVHLDKRIPEQTGLGAGSGDAGTMLLLLNQLHGFPLNIRQLHAIACQIGSDVPFFVESGPCIVRGTGDQVEPLPSFPHLTCCIALPGFRVDTRHAYELLDSAMADNGISAVDPSVSLDVVLEALQKLEPLSRSGSFRLNSFDAALGENTASFLNIRSMLFASGAILAGLSGSGSAVFGIYAERAAASAAALKVQRRASAVQTFVAEIL